MAHALHLYQEEGCLLDALADFVGTQPRTAEKVLARARARWSEQ